MRKLTCKVTKMIADLELSYDWIILYLCVSAPNLSTASLPPSSHAVSKEGSLSLGISPFYSHRHLRSDAHHSLPNATYVPPGPLFIPSATEITLQVPAHSLPQISSGISPIQNLTGSHFLGDKGEMPTSAYAACHAGRSLPPHLPRWPTAPSVHQPTCCKYSSWNPADSSLLRLVSWPGICYSNKVPSPKPRPTSSMGPTLSVWPWRTHVHRHSLFLLLLSC